jgi:hypothetical protein
MTKQLTDEFLKSKFERLLINKQIDTTYADELIAKIRSMSYCDEGGMMPPAFSPDFSGFTSHHTSMSLPHSAYPTWQTSGGRGAGGQHAPRKTIIIEIHSVGGSIHEGFRIVNAIEMAKRHCIVVTVINACAFSIAALIFCAGTNGYRCVSSSSSRMLVHRPRMNPATGRVAVHICDDDTRYATVGQGNQTQGTICKFTHHYAGGTGSAMVASAAAETKSSASSVVKGSSSNPHLDSIHKTIIGEIVKCIVSAYDGTFEGLKSVVGKAMLFLEDLGDNDHKDWMIEPDHLLMYGIANRRSIPEIIHRVEYRQFLLLDNGEQIELPIR